MTTPPMMTAAAHTLTPTPAVSPTVQSWHQTTAGACMPPPLPPCTCQSSPTHRDPRHAPLEPLAAPGRGLELLGDARPRTLDDPLRRRPDRRLRLATTGDSPAGLIASSESPFLKGGHETPDGSRMRAPRVPPSASTSLPLSQDSSPSRMVLLESGHEKSDAPHRDRRAAARAPPFGVQLPKGTTPSSSAARRRCNSASPCGTRPSHGSISSSRSTPPRVA